MKYTLSSQEYNDLFRTASETFDAELIKRDLAIKNMSKKLMIIDYANEFIERKLEFIGENISSSYSSTGYISKVISFKNSFGDTFNQFGHSVHPKFKKDPIDIFNLKLTTGNTMFKNSLMCKVNDEEITDENDDRYYINLLVADNSIDNVLDDIIIESPNVMRMSDKEALNEKLVINVNSLKENENAHLFVNADDGGNVVVNESSLLALALLEIKNLKQEIKNMKEGALIE